ncbi:hypothetical protein ACFE04_011429 [Oxalis oulophora]
MEENCVCTWGRGGGEEMVQYKESIFGGRAVGAGATGQEAGLRKAIQAVKSNPCIPSKTSDILTLFQLGILCRFLAYARRIFVNFHSMCVRVLFSRPPLVPTHSPSDKASYTVVPLTKAICLGAVAGASPYSMGPTSQGTPTPMMSPAPPGGPQDSMGYNLNMNGNDYASPMSGSQTGTRWKSVACESFGAGVKCELHRMMSDSVKSQRNEEFIAELVDYWCSFVVS